MPRGLTLAQWEVIMKRYIVCLILCVIWVGSQRILVEMYVLRIYWATEPQHDIHLRDISQWKSIRQTIINTVEAFHCSKVLVLFEIIHKMPKLPANSPPPPFITHWPFCAGACRDGLCLCFEPAVWLIMRNVCVPFCGQRLLCMPPSSAAHAEWAVLNESLSAI